MTDKNSLFSFKQLDKKESYHLKDVFLKKDAFIGQ